MSCARAPAAEWERACRQLQLLHAWHMLCGQRVFRGQAAVGTEIAS